MNCMSDKHLEKTILTYWPQVRFRVKKSLGSLNPDWEDVSTEVFIGVLEAIRNNKFREESSLGTYIYSITSHKISDYLKKKYKAPKYLSAPVQCPEPDDYVEKKELSKIVLKSVKKLKPRDADILYLYYFSDLTQKQISDIFGLSAKTINIIIRSAKLELKRILRYFFPNFCGFIAIIMAFLP